MPGMSMGLCFRQSLQQRLEQTLEHIMLQRLLLLGGEGECSEQIKVLEKIKNDLDKNIYSDVDDFYNRVMKRIKKEKRTKPVKALVGSIRELVDSTREQGKNITLETVKEFIDLGWSASHSMFEASSIYSEMSRISEKVANPLEHIISTADCITDAVMSASAFFSQIADSDKRTKGEVAVQETYDRTADIIGRQRAGKGLAIQMVADILGKKRTYDRFRMDAFFKIMEQTCELAVPGNQEYKQISASLLIANNELEDLLDKYKNLPLPILSLSLASDLDEKTLERLNQFSGTKHMRSSKDYQRAYLSAMCAIRRVRKGKQIIDDIIAKSNGVKQARDIMSKFAGAFKIGMCNYDFNLPDGDAILKYLKGVTVFRNPVLNELSDEAASKLTAIINMNAVDRHFSAYTPIFKLGHIYKESYEEGIPLLAKILENCVMDKWHAYRYDGPEAGSLMECLRGVTYEWVHNAERRRIPGDVNGLEPQYKAVMKIVEHLKKKYSKIYMDDLTQENVVIMHQIKKQFIDNMVHKAGKKIGDELNELNAKLGYAETVLKLSRPSLKEFPDLQKVISGCLTKYSHPEFRQAIMSIDIIAKSSEMRNFRAIAVRETDDPYELLNCGCVPISSCQRWTEQTSYNKCLLAYVADANKKLFQVLDQHGNIKVRSIVRLIETEELEHPVLFIERPYASLASNDLFKSLVGAVVEKAYRMSADSGEPIAVAVSDADYKKILSEMADTADIEYETGTLRTTIKSRNSCVYSDGFGGTLKNGRGAVCSNAGYILVNHEDN